MRFGNLVQGWRSRPHETKRSPDEKILLVEFTTHPGKRSDLSTLLLSGLPVMEKEEPGTLSMLVIEDAQDENVLYVFERFKDQQALEDHQNAAPAAKVKQSAKKLATSVDLGLFKEVMGFLSKEE
jgi:quinol monooxygenase YgiN